MFDVACVGILVADAITKSVDKLPERGRLGLVESLKLFSGGCAANAAIDLAKLGSRVAIIGMIGNDGFGSFLKGELRKFGVYDEGLIVNENTDTSASVALIDSSGERTFLHCIGANGVFSEKDINYDIIQNSKIIFVAGSMLMPSFDGEDCAVLLKKAKQMGKITVLDTAWDDKGRWMNILESCMQYLDYFLPSIEEAEKLSGETEPEKIAKVFFEMGVKSVAIKLGKDGCYMQENQESEGISISTYTHIKPVDTTGAGDSFCAGFLYGLSQGMEMYECCKLANAVGAHCVMETGASTGIKSYSEINQFIKENTL